MDVDDNAGCLNARVVRALFASRLAPTGAMQILVGAGLPAMDVNDNAGCLNAPIARAFFASGLARTGPTQILVGASLLAMDVNDNAGRLNARVVPAFFVSRLAPTQGRSQRTRIFGSPAPRRSVARNPSNGAGSAISGNASLSGRFAQNVSQDGNSSWKVPA